MVTNGNKWQVSMNPTSGRTRGSLPFAIIEDYSNPSIVVSSLGCCQDIQGCFFKVKRHKNKALLNLLPGCVHFNSCWQENTVLNWCPLIREMMTSCYLPWLTKIQLNRTINISLSIPPQNKKLKSALWQSAAMPKLMSWCVCDFWNSTPDQCHLGKVTVAVIQWHVLTEHMCTVIALFSPFFHNSAPSRSLPFSALQNC